MGQRGQRGHYREPGSPAGAAELLAGRNSVREALLAGRRRVHRLMVAEGSREAGTLAEILSLAAERSVPVERVSREDLDRVADDYAHQGVVALASVYPYVEVRDLLHLARQRSELPFLLALDSIQDPQNVGSLLRTGEAVGVHGVLIPRRRAAGVTTAVSRASAGAVEHLLVAEVTNLVRTLGELKAEGLWVVGVEDDPRAQDYRDVDLNMPIVLVLGGEGSGVRRLVRETCDLLVRLPMRGRIGSLNVSVAGSVLLYHAARSREGWL